MSSRKSIQFAKVLMLAGLLVGLDTAMAEPKASDGGAAIKKAQGMIRQLSQEKSALEAEKATWLKEKADLDAKLQSLEDSVKRLQPLQAEVDRYKSGLENVRSTLESQLGQEKQRQQALLQKHNEVVSKAKDIQADNQLLVQAVQEREQWIAQCGTRNKDLRAANDEILNKYKDKGLLQQLAELEPFTGIGQVETEVAVEDYKYKLKQLKITPYQSTGESAPAAVAGSAESGEVK